MPAYNFQSKFAPMILDGSKCTTIRKRRKKPTRVGNVLWLFTGMRTKECEKFARAVCIQVTPVVIRPVAHQISVIGRWLTGLQTLKLAKQDGFDNLPDFFGFFWDTYKLETLEGFDLIKFTVNGRVP